MASIFELRASHIKRVRALKQAGKVSAKEADSLIFSISDDELVRSASRHRTGGSVKVLARATGTLLDVVGEIDEILS